MTRETNFRTRGQAVFLAVIMVLSMIAMSATMIGGVAADHAEIERDAGEGDRLWAGQVGNFSVDDLDDIVDLYRGDSDDPEEWLGELTVENGFVTVDTAGLATGDYHLDGEETGTIDFEIRRQNLDGTGFAADSVRQGADTTLTIDSNRANFYTYVSSDDLSVEQIEAMFGAASVNATDVPGHAGEEGEWVQLQNRGDFTADFTGIPLGEYEFDLAVADSDAEATLEIEVTEPVPFDFQLTDTYSQHVIGDHAEIEFDATGNPAGETVEIEFEHAATGWWANVTIELDDDVEDDGGLTLSWNTFEAGHGDAINTFSVDNGDPVEAHHMAIPGFRVPQGEYDITIIDAEVDDEIGFGVVDLIERSTDDMTTYIAPAGTDIESVEDLDDLGTARETVAEGDVVVFEIEVNGIFAYGFDADNGTFEHGISFALDQQDVPAFGFPAELNETHADDVILDEDEHRVLLVFDSEALAEDGNEWDATFMISDDNPYVSDEDGESVESSLSIEEPETTLPEQDQIAQAAEVDFTGETNLAPGTDGFALRVFARGEFSFQTQEAVTVQDGMWTTTIENLANEQPNQEITVQLRLDGSVIASYQAMLVEEVAPGQPALSLEDVDAPDAVDPGDTATWVATMQNLGDAEGTATVTLVVESADDVIGEESAEVTVGAGETEDVEFSVVMDVDPGFYGWTVSEDFAATSADGQIEVVDPDPPTPTPTPVPPDTPTPTPEPDDQPGFGLIIALMAILGAALLAYRRYQG